MVGGAETFAVQLAQAQLEQGHDVHLLCIRDKGPLWDRMSEALRSRTTVVAKRSRFDATVLPRAARALRAARPHVVHTHLFTSHAWGTAAAFLARVPTVVHTQHACHDDEYIYLPWFRRRLSHGVDALVGCSEAVVADVQRRHYAPHTRHVRCIDNGIPLGGRPRATLDHSPLRVGTVGRMVEVKGQRFLIEAVALLRDRGIDVELVLIGDGELRPDLEDRVRELGIGDRTRFTGLVSDVPDRLAALDLFVLPSLSEALPITLLETAAAGLPMLVTSGGGCGTLVEAGAGGWIVPPGDAESLAERIEAYEEMRPDTRRAMGQASYDLVMSRYDIRSTAARYEALYRELLTS